MSSRFEDIPKRIFLDSCLLQTLQSYGFFIYDGEDILANDPIHRDPKGIIKLEALRNIIEVAERAPFQFALSENSFQEVNRRGDSNYLQWAYEILNHWIECCAGSDPPQGNDKALMAIDSNSYNYLGAGDRALLKDAIALECDSFLTMENKLPKSSDHIQRTLGIRVMTPESMWGILRLWAALFR
jgi:hypothetical protein